MKIKRYQARKMVDVMQQIKSELGPEAVILQQKPIKKGGFLGLFQQNYIEVVAALDEDMPKKKPNTISHNKVPPTSRYSQDQELMKELKQLKKLMMVRNESSKEDFPPAFEYANQYLQTQGIDKNLAKKWLQQIEENVGDIELTVDYIKESLRQIMMNEWKDMHQEYPSQPKKIVQFVGPTGVGKTTTLAKIAAKYILEKEKHVAFITLDTYRIGAVEQLKTYATILNVPIEVAYSHKEYIEALEKFGDYDMIFVDTAGRNYLDERYIKELKEMMTIPDEDITSYLVLSLTAKTEDMTDVFDQFTTIPIEALIFTKMDETSSYGNIINMVSRKKLPVAYITNGQNVPDDVLEISIPSLIQQILRGYDNE